MGAFIPATATMQAPKPPADPLAMYSEMLQIQEAQNRQRYLQQQTQGLQLENQQRQLQLQDAQTLRSIAPNHLTRDEDGKVNGYDWQGLFDEASQRGVNPATLNKMQMDQADVRQKLASASKSERENWEGLMKEAYEHVEGVRGIQDPQQRQQLYSHALGWAAKNKVDISQFPKQAPDDNGLSPIESQLGMTSQHLADAKTAAEGQKMGAEAGLSQIKLGLAQNTKPGDYDQLISQAASNNPTLAGRTQREVNFYLQRGDIENANKALTRMSEQLGEVEKETNPAALAAKLHLATATKAAEQAISDGDPRAAAQLLISGTVAPSQLVSSRKPAFAQQAFSAAAKMQPGWSATKADADYKVASSSANVAFFGSAKSLTDKGGTLDQLADAAKDIPANKIPIFNTVADALKASTGSGPIAKYAAIALGVADDYSKVMGGGQGSDTSRTQALQLISAKQSPAQRAASIEGIRGSVLSQTNSRIGNNAVLEKMYGGQGSIGQTAGGKSGNANDPLGIR